MRAAARLWRRHHIVLLFLSQICPRRCHELAQSAHRAPVRQQRLLRCMHQPRVSDGSKRSRVARQKAAQRVLLRLRQAGGGAQQRKKREPRAAGRRCRRGVVIDAEAARDEAARLVTQHHDG